MPVKPAQIARLIDQIRDCLWAHPEGLSEYALLNEIRAAGLGMERPPIDDMLALFQQHFLLMHCLYRLQGQLNAEEGMDLEIGPLCIRLQSLPEAGGVPGLTPMDPLRAYYLDLSHLDKTGAEDVASMLRDFWERHEATGERAAALSELGLHDPVDARDIKRRYRQLAMRHHPDRGGDTAQLQRLHAAMRVLQTTGAA